MTQARALLAPNGQAGHYHCVARCVRRAWLCGLDRPSGKSFEHRKPIVEKRILELGNIFAVGVYSYAVMSNHLHVVPYVLPDRAREWAADEVGARWLALFPSSKTERAEERRAALLSDPDRLELCRSRLSSLSGFMRCLNEHLAKRFNAEDMCTGRFWEGRSPVCLACEADSWHATKGEHDRAMCEAPRGPDRFKCQALLNDKAMLAAMAYVDLNPVRAGIAKSVSGSKHSGVRKGFRQIAKGPALAAQSFGPLAGYAATAMPKISASEYIELVDWTGRQFAPGKLGVIDADEPAALRKLGLDPKHWVVFRCASVTRHIRGMPRKENTRERCDAVTARAGPHRVRGIGNAYWRVVGSVEEMLDKARSLQQRWVHGIRYARAEAGLS